MMVSALEELLEDAKYMPDEEIVFSHGEILYTISDVYWSVDDHAFVAVLKNY